MNSQKMIFFYFGIESRNIKIIITMDISHITLISELITL